jgi:hypothetical protein
MAGAASSSIAIEGLFKKEAAPLFDQLLISSRL